MAQGSANQARQTVLSIAIEQRVLFYTLQENSHCKACNIQSRAQYYSYNQLAEMGADIKTTDHF